jgi:serine/threonine protein kinase
MAVVREALQLGTQIDDFVLIERVFSGGMGAIWRAERLDGPQPGDPAQIVLKIPFISAGSDVAAIVAFEIEHMVMQRLVGPHVPRVIGLGDLADIPYIAMEFVEGPSLETYMDMAPVQPEEVLRIGRLLARAIADLHRQHVIHLDLKPANVILAQRGAVLLDFGLARHDELPDLMGEETHLPVGSAAYMAPEQAFGDRSQPASDLFAIGAIMFRLATGDYPYGVPITTKGLQQRADADIARLVPKLAKIPAGLAEIILRCLEPKAHKRYPTADQLLFDLNQPDQVSIVERRPQPMKRWYAAVGDWWAKPPVERPIPGNLALRLARAPVILAAVDLTNGEDQLAEMVRIHAQRAIDSEPQSRLACITVLKSKVIGTDPETDEEGRSMYHSRLVTLREWARPLKTNADTISLHVIEAVDPASAILEYVEHNGIDHIVMGARASSRTRRHLGSVSSKVVARAPCSVTVVRLRLGGEVTAEPLGEDYQLP